MKVNGLGFQTSSYNTNNNTETPTFTALHQSRYFLKCESGEFQEITSSKVIKGLQRKLVTWLNKLHNDSTKIMQGKTPKNLKSESLEEKTLRERLIRFFLNNDRDYFKHKVVRSFYTTDRNGAQKSYILTGDSISIVDEAAKPIGKKRGIIKHKTNVISEYYGIDIEKAKTYISEKEVLDVMEATRNYHNSVENAVNNILAKNRAEDTIFDAYFVPRQKGKNLVPELVDAKFVKK